MAHCPPLVCHIVNDWLLKVEEIMKDDPAAEISSEMLDAFFEKESCIYKMSDDFIKRCSDAGSLYMEAYNERRLAEEQYENAPKRSKARAEAKRNLDVAKYHLRIAWHRLIDLKQTAEMAKGFNHDSQKVRDWIKKNCPSKEKEVLEEWEKWTFDNMSKTPFYCEEFIKFATKKFVEAA